MSGVGAPGLDQGICQESGQGERVVSSGPVGMGTPSETSNRQGSGTEAAEQLPVRIQPSPGPTVKTPEEGRVTSPAELICSICNDTAFVSLVSPKRRGLLILLSISGPEIQLLAVTL